MVRRLFHSKGSPFGGAYRGASLIRTRTPYDPTVGICLGPYESPVGGEFSDK